MVFARRMPAKYWFNIYNRSAPAQEFFLKKSKNLEMFILENFRYKKFKKTVCKGSRLHNMVKTFKMDLK